MQFKPYAKSLAVALSFAFVAGCASSGGTQDGALDGTAGSGTGTSTTGQGMASGQQSGTAMQAGQQGRIPDVRTIYFDFDSDQIRSEFQPVLTAHARYLSNNGNAKVVLEGHTDERGTREYNVALGERRAKAVERFLTVQGVSPSQFEIVSYGEERPAVRGHGEDTYAQNRRVVFSY
ncbi:peptidoglycan-associated lipoprotein [Litchfieldella qijiaojingensis]|uniref:Peptidoglycan-associated lipoprotein n=1 Tax=Litchfieldella qijiaojingensis TaxID=980347 RepID=A0ABQ2YBQ9_9GAMM|nr:peptidoglycan-associated lipoprotein Pal [Halomonas qijiaojingensis]GGX79229.1 peptidoglycan-associated lipoprotein [Halomonas qijiaojingensis]